MEYIFDLWSWTIVASIVGMVTGVLALVISVLNHLRVNAMKSLDLRLEAGRTKNEIEAALKKVQLLHGSTNNSHRIFAEMMGMSQSSMMDIWRSKQVKNTASIEEWAKQFSGINIGDLKNSPEKLEKALILLHGILEQINSLINEYENTIAEDEKTIANVDRQRQQL